MNRTEYPVEQETVNTKSQDDLSVNNDNQLDITAVKSPMHLSVPDVNIPNHVESPNSVAVMLGKPMSRDLKSVHQKDDED